ncbi:ATP-grasp domain-containing protein [Aggregatibacter kilianii]|uniref:ATP-grasp domain-containing protein n=1 Tax=Aggregatibacter kilianii TaxID=2025884 RepID=UPI000D644F4A|nr:glutathione synthetase [Aggregatibacter kilianii]
MLTITTCNTYPNPPQNLLPLQQALIKSGISTAFKPWQETTDSPFILPLCAWDYTLFYEAFIHWIKQYTSHFINPAELMLWNSHKGYLCDLQQWGVNVIPTVICPANSSEISTALQRQNWQEYVIKPAIGQSGNLVTKLKADDPLPDLTAYGKEIVLQPFIPDVATHGETSLIFFNGNFSHAIRRQPPQNEWRANSQYKVEIIPTTVSEHIITTAESMLKKLPVLPKYARVDGTLINGDLLLNELELIEPALYLDRAEGATERFVEVLKEHIKK